MKDVYEDKKRIHILMECMEGGELFEHIRNYEISEREALLITF